MGVGTRRNGFGEGKFVVVGCVGKTERVHERLRDWWLLRGGTGHHDGDKSRCQE
jgi:hypothetical protein